MNTKYPTNSNCNHDADEKAQDLAWRDIRIIEGRPGIAEEKERDDQQDDKDSRPDWGAHEEGVLGVVCSRRAAFFATARERIRMIEAPRVCPPKKRLSKAPLWSISFHDFPRV